MPAKKTSEFHISKRTFWSVLVSSSTQSTVLIQAR